MKTVAKCILLQLEVYFSESWHLNDFLDSEYFNITPISMHKLRAIRDLKPPARMVLPPGENERLTRAAIS